MAIADRILAYDYVDAKSLGKGATQYDGEYDLAEERMVEARYIKSFLDKGNPLVEALPKPLGVDELARMHTCLVSAPTEEELREMDAYEQISSVEVLDGFRVAFPFHLDLELSFYRALCNSYRKRWVRYDRNTDIPYTINNVEKIQHQFTEIKHVSNATTGFTLLGVSGCGKSTAINMMLDRYPQVILHNPNTVHEFPQIVWLHVNATAHSNFSLLYNSIGRAIDRALNNLTPIYEAEVASVRGLGLKYAKIRELVEKFSIGIIIIDEIELMDVMTTKENSIETFLTLTNETGVAIAVVGTEDAYMGLFSKRRTARRTGVLIQGASYCGNMVRFDYILNLLFKISWFRPEDAGWLERKTDADGTVSVVAKSVPKDIRDAFFKKTDGVISDIVGLYREVTKEYIRNRFAGKGYAKITPAFVETVADKYFEGLRRTAMKDMVEKVFAKEVQEKAHNLLDMPADRIESQDIEKRFDKVTASRAYQEEILLRENVVTAIIQKHDYPRNAVYHAFMVVVDKENVLGLPFEKVVELTLKVLIAGEKKQARKKSVSEAQKADIDKRREELLGTRSGDFE